MKINEKIEKYINKNTDKSFVMVDQSDLERISSDLEKNMKELERKKLASSRLLMDFRDMIKKVEDLIKKSDKTISIQERFIGIGSNGTVEVYGKNVIISKNGKSVELTKDELIEIVNKLGL